MEKITKFAIDNSRLTILLIVSVIFIGLGVFLNMPRQEDPEITIREAQINAYFPGMSATLIEDLIAKPIERMVKQMPEVEDIKTTIRTGSVLVQPKVYDKYFDLDPIWQDLRNKMNDVQSELPEGTVGPIVNDDFGEVAAITIAISGRGFELSEIRDVAYDLQDKIGLMTSVSKVDLYGVQSETIFLDFDINRLANYGISEDALIRALTQQNIILPGGSITADDREIAIEPSGNFQSIEDIKNLQISIPGSEEIVYLQDIVNIRRDYADPPTTPAYYDNKEAIIMGVVMAKRYNIEKFGHEITSKVKELQKDLPIGLELEFSTYQPDLVVKSVTDATNNLYQTIAVVLAIVILFLGLRMGLIVGAIVPLTILLSLIVMYLWGIDLQRMSIAAIIIALGLLVDNGIVIAEDIKNKMDKGVAKYDAVIAASGELGTPLLTSSLTTIAAFTPLMMADNVVGEFMTTLSQVVIISLLASWFLAIYATPALCYWFLPENKNAEHIDESQHNNSSLHLIYKKILEQIIRFRVIFILSMVGLLFVSLMGFKLITKQMMPYSDRNQVLIYMDLPAGVSIEKTIKETRFLTSWLSDKKLNPNIKNNIAYVGFGGPRFVLSLSPPDPGNNVAFLVVNTNSNKDVDELVKSINQFILDEMPDVDGTAKKMWLGSTEIGLAEYRITGLEVDKLYDLSYLVQAKMSSIDNSYGIVNDWQNPVARMKIDIDQSRARRSNITSQDVAYELNTYFDGAVLGDYREADKSIPIILRGDSKRNNLGELQTLDILSQDLKTVPLIQIANFWSSIGPNKFMNYNQERTITVSGKNRFLQASQIHEIMWPFIESLDLPDGYKVEVGGEVEGSGKANKALFSNMPFAIIVIILLLVWQFNSFRRPAIIMLTIPLVLIGAVAGLITANAFLSFTAILGLYSLAGIIVNNGIVLIDKIDSERKLDDCIESAVVNACLARVRPIIMTTLTTILGLIPLALFGGELWYPMSIVIMSGLAVGTVLTLGFVPALYVLFFKNNWKMDKRKN
ncbi:MAG: multidrug efflux pump subunit AcrB [Rickettsiales bacterium]|jgi:multidrug efflux pump subunit AcrB